MSVEILTLEQLDEINKRKLDVNLTYHGGWDADEDEYDYINKETVAKGVRLS